MLIYPTDLWRLLFDVVPFASLLRRVPSVVPG